MSQSRRALQGSGVAAAPLLVAGTATASNVDAKLMAMAAELRAIEAAYNEGCHGPDEWTETPEAEAMMARLKDLIGHMSKTPAVGLAGIAAKAGRICFSLHPRLGGLMYCEEALVASLTADLARLAPHAVGPAA
jgi:hypothetical protein